MYVLHWVVLYTNMLNMEPDLFIQNMSTSLCKTDASLSSWVTLFLFYLKCPQMRNTDVNFSSPSGSTCKQTFLFTNPTFLMKSWHGSKDDSV